MSGSPTWILRHYCSLSGCAIAASVVARFMIALDVRCFGQYGDNSRVTACWHSGKPGAVCKAADWRSVRALSQPVCRLLPHGSGSLTAGENAHMATGYDIETAIRRAHQVHKRDHSILRHHGVALAGEGQQIGGDA